MRYLCLVHFDAPELFDRTLDETAKRQLDIDSLAYDRELEEAGHMIHAEALQGPETAVLVRMRDGSLTATDGPFIELKELLGGFAVLNVNSLDEAIEWSKRFLQIVGGGESEIVQLLGPDDFGPA